jgi:hypothetical protein
MSNFDRVAGMLRKEYDRLSKEMRAVSAALSAFGGAYGKGPGKMSAAARGRIAAAQKARWAKVKAGKKTRGRATTAHKRTMSASARKKIAAAQRARWAKAKTANKVTH